MHAIPQTPTANTIPARVTTTRLAPCWIIVSLDGKERGRYNEISDAYSYTKAAACRDRLTGEIAREEAAAKAAAKPAPTHRTWYAPSPELDARMDAGQEAIADPNFLSLCLALESAPF